MHSTAKMPRPILSCNPHLFGSGLEVGTCTDCSSGIAFCRGPPAGQAGTAASRGHITGQHGCKARPFPAPWCRGVHLQCLSLATTQWPGSRRPDRRTEYLETCEPSCPEPLQTGFPAVTAKSKDWGADSFKPCWMDMFLCSFSRETRSEHRVHLRHALPCWGEKWERIFPCNLFSEIFPDL